jgi:hypothetical protein
MNSDSMNGWRMRRGALDMSDIWSYRTVVRTAGSGLVGYRVEATDGGIGKIDEASTEAGSAFVVVDTGPWIFGKKRMIPARVIERIDDAEERVYVRMTKDQIKDAPDFDESHRSRPADYDTYYSRYDW